MDVTLLSEALPSFPNVLLPIIVAYAKPRPHAWLNDESAAHPVTIVGNRLTCQTIDPTRRWPWYFVGSDQTVVDGPDRWKLSWTLGEPGWIYVGVTTGTNGITSITDCNWMAAASADNFLVGLTISANDIPSKVAIIHNGEADLTSAGTYRKKLQPTESASASFEADYDKQTLRIRFETVDLLLPIPQTMQRLNKIWRPCIVGSGFFTAVILPSEEKTSLTIADELDAAGQAGQNA